MNRRELLKSVLPVSAISVMASGAEAGKTYKIESDAKYIVFLDERAGIDIETFCRSCASLPPGTPVYFYDSWGSGEDPAKIYKLI